VVDGADRASVATFYAPGAWSARVELTEAAAHHATVKRLAIGDPVRLTSGDGRRVHATIASLAKRRLDVECDFASMELTPRPSQVEIWAPVGDRDRMLLLAEKVAELGASAWRTVVYRRSRSVSPRGEGDAFHEKVRFRMIAALEQSGGAWLPDLLAEAEAASVIPGAPPGGAILLDPRGQPLHEVLATAHAPLVLALGPEGGLDPLERAAFVHSGWRTASLGSNILRFETAGIAGLALARALSKPT
jgi:16S rRNA (uracil1498-N3)-methyltransferase